MEGAEKRSDSAGPMRKATVENLWCHGGKFLSIDAALAALLDRTPIAGERALVQQLRGVSDRTGRVEQAT